MTSELAGRDTKEIGCDPCPLCRSADSRRIYPQLVREKYFVCKCVGCSLVFVSPRPTVDELARFYASEDYFEGADCCGYANYRATAEPNMVRMWRDLSAKLPPDIPSKSLLDVGCATGMFLAQAKTQGWRTLGTDLSPQACQIAAKEHDVQVLNGDLLTLDLPAESFGLITMWHVLEHVIEPLATLQAAVRLLQPGGYLFIELPNWNSMGRLVKGTRWSQLRPPEHINFFTPRTLQRTVIQAGLEVAWLQSSYPSFEQLAEAHSHSIRWQSLGILAAGASKLGLGGYLRTLARRPG